MLPWNSEYDPIVAELATCHQTLEALARWSVECGCVPRGSGAICGSKCTVRLEDEHSIRIALAVEGDIPGYRDRRGGFVDAGSEPVVAERGGLPATFPRVVGAAIGMPPPNVPAAGDRPRE